MEIDIWILGLGSAGIALGTFLAAAYTRAAATIPKPIKTLAAAAILLAGTAATAILWLAAILLAPKKNHIDLIAYIWVVTALLPSVIAAWGHKEKTKTENKENEEDSN